MNWEEYKDKFFYFAKFSGKDDTYIDDCLKYAEKLFLKDLPVIFDVQHFSLLVGYKETYIMKVINSPNHFYREFRIPKKNKDEFRNISEPLPNLKNIQRWILEEILYKLQPSPYSKAFRIGYSIRDNARFHRNQKKVLTIDIKDYFKSIGFKKVYSLFRGIGYSNQVAVALANICILDNGLPQGAPTSPMLSNLITKRLDSRVASFVSKLGIRYTRYADDLTFSGNFEEGLIINFIREVLKSEGFLINENKTRLRKQNQQQEVTGIVVNQKLQASRNYRRAFRQKMYYIKKYGLENHVTALGIVNKELYVYHLLGTANFILSVNPNDIEVKSHYEFLKHLLFQHNLSKSTTDALFLF